MGKLFNCITVEWQNALVMYLYIDPPLTVHCCAGKPLILPLMWMPLDTSPLP